MYAAALKFGAIIVAAGLSLVCEIPTRLIREIVIRCSNMISKNYARPISWLVKEINKKKSQKMFRKVLITKKLSNRDIMIIINIEKVKKQLE